MNDDVKHFWRGIALLPIGTLVKIGSPIWTVQKHLKESYKLVMTGDGCTAVCKVPYSRTEELKPMIVTKLPT